MKTVSRLLSLAILLSIAGFFAHFALTNGDSITLRLYRMPSIHTPLYLAIFCAFGAGLLLAGLWGLWEVLKSEAGKRKLTKRVKLLEKELESLKRMSLGDLDTSSRLDALLGSNHGKRSSQESP